MRFSRPTFQWQHTGICPMCQRSTKANVHQQCGIAREAELRAKRKPRLKIAKRPNTTCMER